MVLLTVYLWCSRHSSTCCTDTAPCMLLTPSAVNVVGASCQLFVWACSRPYSNLSCSSASRHSLRPYSRLPQPRASAIAEEGLPAARRGQHTLHKFCCPALPGVCTDRAGCPLPGPGAVLPPLSRRLGCTTASCNEACIKSLSQKGHAQKIHVTQPTWIQGSCREVRCMKMLIVQRLQR